MAIKRLMAKGLPDYLVNQFTTEVRLATRRMFTARRHGEISASVFESRPREKQTLSSGETSIFHNARKNESSVSSVAAEFRGRDTKKFADYVLSSVMMKTSEITSLTVN
jgi:hypothetical protein